MLMSNYGVEKVFVDLQIFFVCSNVGDCYVYQVLIEGGGVFGGEVFGYLLCLDWVIIGDGIVSVLQVLVVLCNSGQILCQVLKGLVWVLQKMVNVWLGNVLVKVMVQVDSVQVVLVVVQQLVVGCGCVFLCLFGIELVVCVMVEVDDVLLMQDMLDCLFVVVCEVVV